MTFRPPKKVEKVESPKPKDPAPSILFRKILDLISECFRPVWLSTCPCPARGLSWQISTPRPAWVTTPPPTPVTSATPRSAVSQQSSEQWSESWCSFWVVLLSTSESFSQVPGKYISDRVESPKRIVDTQFCSIYPPWSLSWSGPAPCLMVWPATGIRAPVTTVTAWASTAASSATAPSTPWQPPSTAGPTASVTAWATATTTGTTSTAMAWRPCPWSGPTPATPSAGTPPPWRAPSTTPPRSRTATVQASAETASLHPWLTLKAKFF